MSALDQVFAYVCAREHVWAPGGTPLPFCERCTGLYVGGALALLLYLLFRPRPTNRVLWAHGLLLLLMVPFGYHWVPQNDVLRTLTGQLFAFGLVYFLALNPAVSLNLWQGRTEHVHAYAIGAAAATVGLQVAVRAGDARAGVALAWIGFAGLAAYAILAAANLVVLSSAAWRMVHRQSARNPS